MKQNNPLTPFGETHKLYQQKGVSMGWGGVGGLFPLLEVILDIDTVPKPFQYSTHVATCCRPST